MTLEEFITHITNYTEASTTLRDKNHTKHLTATPGKDGGNYLTYEVRSNGKLIAYLRNGEWRLTNMRRSRLETHIITKLLHAFNYELCQHCQGYGLMQLTPSDIYTCIQCLGTGINETRK